MARPGTWTFLTNHGQLLLSIAREPGLSLREIGDHVGITERAAHRIVSELEASGYLTRKREGRRDAYTIRPQLPFPDPVLRERQIGELLDVLAEQSPVRRRPSGHGALDDPAEA
jgi:predicted ArsR family transcriptional regulator